MANYSLHIGLNRVNPDVYGGWDGQLFGCQNDALAMATVAGDLGYATSIFLDQEATMKSVMDALHVFATQTTAGDTVLITYSGHGGQVYDESGDEVDGLDETWVLYNGIMIDDEILRCLAEFRSGVRLIVVSDSCHSGTVAKAMPLLAQPPKHGRVKYAPPAACRAAYAAGNYTPHPGKRPRIKAATVLLSGCKDNQYSYDGEVNGVFTQKLLWVYALGEYGTGYTNFRRAIVRNMPREQTPQILAMGAKDKTFLGGKPFATLR